MRRVPRRRFHSGSPFHVNNLRRLVNHLSGDVPEQVRLPAGEVFRVSERCQKCHQREWRSGVGGHRVAYRELFLDAKHNHQELLMDDCLRCHGTHYDGSIRDLVTPSIPGPLETARPALADRPPSSVELPRLHHHAILWRPAEKP